MRSSVYTAILGIGSSAYAASTVNQKCVGQICYSANVPDVTSSSGSGDVFFQITGPSDYGWIGMGTGSSMSGSSMLIIYQSADGQNVTLSPRKGSGHNQPGVDSSAKASLMEGSGIVNGQMVANIRCSSCSSSTSSFIFAASGSGSIKSDSTSQNLPQHDGDKYGSLALNLASAKGGDNVNPFVAVPVATTGTDGAVSTVTPTVAVSTAKACVKKTSSASAAAATTTGNTGPFGGNRATGTRAFGPFQTNYKRDADDDCEDTSSSSSSDLNNNAVNITQKNNMKRMAHGILAGLAFAVFFPFGAISIRLFSFTGLIWFHAGIQIIATIMFLAAFIIGLGMAKDFGEMTHYHPIIGIVLFVLCLIQPALGQLHHIMFKKTGGRTSVSHGHIWLGRAIITLGIVNGGLGFKLSSNTNIGPIIYTVVAVIFYIAYIVAIVIGERRRASRIAMMPPKYTDSTQGSAGPTSPNGYNIPQQPGGFYGPRTGEYEMGSRRNSSGRTGRY